MEEKQNKTNCNIVIIIILMIMVLGLGGYIFYDKVISDHFTIGSIDKAENKKDNKNKVTEDVVKSIYSKYMDKKFDTITVFYYGGGDFSSIYNGLYSDITTPTILYDYYKYEWKITMSFYELEKRDGSKISYSYNESDIDSKLTRSFSIDDIKSAYLDLFGKEKEFKAQTFNSHELGTCTIEDDKFVCTIGPHGYITGPIFKLTAYDKYEVRDDMIYIYENTIIYTSEDGKYYSIPANSSDYTGNHIKELDNKDNSILFDSEYSKYFNYYKLGFKQNADGTYYWYNIEKVK